MYTEPFDRFQNLFDQSGVSEYVMQSQTKKYRKIGKNYALKLAATKKYYEGVKDSLSNDDKVQTVVMQVLAKGLSAAVIIFLLEYLSNIGLNLVWMWMESREVTLVSEYDNYEWNAAVQAIFVQSSSNKAHFEKPMVNKRSRSRDILPSERGEFKFLL